MGNWIVLVSFLTAWLFTPLPVSAAVLISLPTGVAVELTAADYGRSLFWTPAALQLDYKDGGGIIGTDRFQSSQWVYLDLTRYPTATIFQLTYSGAGTLVVSLDGCRVCGTVPGSLLSVLQLEAVQIAVSSYAVGLLFMLVSLPAANRQKVQLAFLIIEIFCFPIWFVNFGWWVISQYLFVAVYVILEAFGRLVRTR